jgi:hypothetical protein
VSNPDAYFAGIVDGEGCIGLYVRRGSRNSGRGRTLSLTVGMTHLPILEALKARFGGSINKRTKQPGQKKQQYAWAVAANLAKTCLVALLPYLIEKKEQALTALEARAFQEANNLQGANAKHHDAELEACYQKMDEYAATLSALKSKEFL